MDPAGEQEVLRLQLGLLDPLLHGIPSCRSDLELHRALRLVLHHHGAGCHLIAVADVPDLEANEVAATELAVDAEIEECQLTQSILHLQPDAQRPDVLELEWRLLPDDLALVPRLGVDGVGDGSHDGLRLFLAYCVENSLSMRTSRRSKIPTSQNGLGGAIVPWL